LRVRLSREPSWANIRDKLATGALDGAHLLAPMALAATLGIEPIAEPVVTGLALGLGGNALTVSNRLRARLAEAGRAAGASPAEAASRPRACSRRTGTGAGPRCASPRCSRSRCTATSCDTGSPGAGSRPAATCACGGAAAATRRVTRGGDDRRLLRGRAVELARSSAWRRCVAVPDPRLVAARARRRCSA
jgi:hypothetical protein